jgi:sortase A
LKSIALNAITTMLIAVGVIVLLYTAYVRFYGEAFQAYQERAFRESLAHPAERGLEPSKEPVRGSVVARLEIPSIELSVIVLEGVDDSELLKGAGHVPGTAMPGEPGNVGIAAHRDTFFRPLRNVKAGDLIILTTLEREVRYEVEKTWVTEPSDVAVLDDVDTPALTLITCYPFSYIGPAPDRFIVRARKLDEVVSQQVK